MTNVRGGSLVFWGGEGQDGFYIRTLKHSVGVRSQSIEQPQSHGEFDIPVLRTSRLLTIEGPCITTSPEVQSHRESQLRGFLGGGESGLITLDTPGGPRWGYARLNDVEFEPTLWGIRADYLLRLKFANPRLFGETRTFAAGTPAHHFGNFAAAPVHTVTGAGPGYTINGPDGRQFTVTEPVTVGHPHTVDMATGFLEVDGVVVSGAVTSADTWSIPGGGQVTHTLTGSGLTLSTAVTDTYI